MAESFGRLLQRYRVAAGLSQEDLAELAGVSTNAISALERGLRHAPHSATVDLLIVALRLNDDARREIEEAAKLARARRIQGRRPELRSASPDEVVLNNLPPELTSFVDREEEVPEIKALLQSHRLVTLVGTGGAGKTRCAIKVGGDILIGFADGVWVADLTAISDPDLVSTVIARALKVQEAPNRALLETLLAFLKHKRMLLILDNCEHVIDETRRVTSAILHDCQDIRILATSREKLSILGEQTYRMPSLPVPSPSELLSANEMAQYGAVQLFSDRAFSTDNRFTLSVESAPHVADICRQLDGIPLAIELAAARVATLSPKQLAQRLDERFRVLTGGDRGGLPRHRTMRALIDWSYDLLSDDERKLLQNLSIFAGGFTLQTAAAVFSVGEVDEIVVLDLLSSLVDKSLVQAEPLGEATRYRLLESTRQYAHEKLTDAGDEETAARAHAIAFLGLAEQLHDAWEITPDRVWSENAEPELDNFRAALSWAFSERGVVLLGQRLACALRTVWSTLRPTEGQRWVQVAQRRVSADTPATILAALDFTESLIAVALNEFRASLAPAERALARYRELDDRRGCIVAKGVIGRTLIFLGKTAEGEELVRQALETARSLGMRRMVIFALDGLASARRLAGDLSEASQLYSEALALARAVGAERSAAVTALNLAEVEFQGGDAAAALRLADETLAVSRAFGDARHIFAQYNVAAYLVSLRRYDAARTVAREALSVVRDAQVSIELAWGLQHLAAIAALRPGPDATVTEDRRRAARILGYADARCTTLETLRQYTEQQEYEAMLPVLREALGAAQFASLMAEGATWSEDQAIAEAMLI